MAEERSISIEVVYRGIFQKTLAQRICRSVVLAARKKGHTGTAFARYGDSPERNGVPEAVQVCARGEARKPREQHGRDCDGEHPLGEHVDAESRVDRAWRETRIDEPRREERVDDEVEVDEPEPDRHGDHQDEHAADRRVSPVHDEAESSVEAPKPRERQQHLDQRADHDRDRVDVELCVERFRARDAEDEARDDREVPEDG